jgi:uncharacterized membrane protein YphA (DoxX/SURF4 family)
MKPVLSTLGIWALRILAALIMLQSLLFKFSAADESVYIFSKIGMEPWGRIGIGILELIAGILILIPRTSVFGALLAIPIMMGAIFFHLTTLGINVQGDHGQLFSYAIIVLLCSSGIVIIQKNYLLYKLSKAFSKS